jgi:hypothetical protein
LSKRERGEVKWRSEKEKETPSLLASASLIVAVSHNGSKGRQGKSEEKHPLKLGRAKMGFFMQLLKKRPSLKKHSVE